MDVHTIGCKAQDRSRATSNGSRENCDSPKRKNQQNGDPKYQATFNPTARTAFRASDFCSFTVDRRINPEENLEEEKRRLHDALEGFEIETLQEEAAAATPAQDPLGVILSRHIASLTAKEPAFEMCPALLETRFYAAYGIPAFAYGPGRLTVSHGPNEFVPLRNIVQCATIYALTATEVLR